MEIEREQKELKTKCNISAIIYNVFFFFFFFVERERETDYNAMHTNRYTDTQRRRGIEYKR